MVSTVTTYGPLAVAWTLTIHIVILALMVDVVVYIVMRCLLETYDSNPARCDRECLLHLSSRLKMWELAAKVRV